MTSVEQTHAHFKESLADPTSLKPKYLYTDFVNIVTDEVSATEKLEAAHRNIEFLQQEHSTTLHGLHEEIERLQEHVRELQFSREVLGIIAPENEFFKCDITTLQQKVDNLIQDNKEMRKKLQESNRALETLDQKQKLEHWQHHQELEEKEKTILRLQKELEVKCSMVAELTAQLTRKRKGSFLRRFSFVPGDAPSASSIVDAIQSLRCSDDADGSQAAASSCSLPTGGSPLHSINCDQSSYSSLSDKSMSDDEVLRSPFLRKQYTFPSPKYGCRQKWWGRAQTSENVLHLPPIKGLVPKRPFVRQQIRVDKIATKVVSNPLAIDKVSLPELMDKRVSNV